MIPFVVNQSLALLHQSLKQKSYAVKQYMSDKVVSLWWMHDYRFLRTAISHLYVWKNLAS